MPQPAVTVWLRFGHERLDGSPTERQLGMRVIDCPGERRVRENRMHGVGGGGRKRADDAQPYMARWVVYRWRASRLPHTPEWAIAASSFGLPPPSTSGETLTGPWRRYAAWSCLSPESELDASRANSTTAAGRGESAVRCGVAPGPASWRCRPARITSCGGEDVRNRQVSTASRSARWR